MEIFEKFLLTVGEKRRIRADVPRCGSDSARAFGNEKFSRMKKRVDKRRKKSHCAMPPRSGGFFEKRRASWEIRALSSIRKRKFPNQYFSTGEFDSGSD